MEINCFDEYPEVTDKQLICLLDLLPVKEEQSIISRTDFNLYVKSEIYDANPDDVLSILLEIRLKYDVDEEYFASLLDDISKDIIYNKIIEVNLLKEKQENLL